MQMDSVGISCASPARTSTSSTVITTTPAGPGQGQPHILRKATRKRNKGDTIGSISNIQQQNDAVSTLHSLHVVLSMLYNQEIIGKVLADTS